MAIPEKGMDMFAYGSTLEDAVVVALHTEDGFQLLASGTAQVSKEEMEAVVTIEGDLPDYFMASAYLMDSFDLSPLCAAYETPMYTREMQELLNSTVEDYDSERVLNLDDDNTTNFAVFGENTIVLEAVEGVNTVAQIDDETATYVLENADEIVTNLRERDVFVYPYAENELLIIKVADIHVDGSTATITGSDDVEMEEIFSHVKIEASADGSDATVEPGSGDEGITYLGSSGDQTTFAPRGIFDGSYEDGDTKTFSHEFGIQAVLDEDIKISGTFKL